MLLLISINLLSSKAVVAQTQFQGWVASFNTFTLKKPLSLHFDAQLRSTDQVKQVQTLLLRSGLNYHITKNMIVTAGYAFISNRRVVATVSGYAPEHRIWEQFIIQHPVWHTSLSHRFRLEQRFISRSYVANNELKNSGNTFAQRLRYFGRSVVPLSTKKPFKKGPFAALQNEVFVNIGDKSAVNGKFFDQNRAYLALGYRLKTSFDAEIGYMNQYISGRNGTFTNNHILQVAGYLRL